MRKIRTLSIVTLLLLSTAGCDDNSSHNKTSKADTQPNLADIFAKKTPDTETPLPNVMETEKSAPTPTPLPEADKTTPEDKYVLLNTGNQIMFHYLAMMGTPIDYPEVLTSYSQDYNRATDEFKKNDLLNALRPKIDSEVARAKATPYVKMLVENPIEKYDFSEKGFPVSDVICNENSFRYFSDNGRYKIGFTNGAAFKYLKPASEDDARKIEALRSKYQPMEMVVYGFIQDADPSMRSIKAEIVKVVLTDKKGAVLATQQ